MAGRHSPPKGGRYSQELLYDPQIPTPNHGERARTLIAPLTTGTLCTAGAAHEGHPYGSFVTFALFGGDPIFLMSALAEHTKNLRKDPRCSLLAVEPGEGDPLARGRVTLVGTGDLVDSEHEDAEGVRQAYLATHPQAAYYVDYKDFGFWRLKVDAIRYIGGYGRMSWVEPDAWADSEPDPMAAHGAAIIQHMNEDHPDTMVLYCQAFSKAKDTTEATMTGIDRYGFEMSAQTAAGRRPIRVAFSEPVQAPEEVRQQMVALAKAARQSTVSP